MKLFKYVVLVLQGDWPNLLSSVRVTIDGVWIGNWIYLIFSTCV
jgi:hypothetical protein